MMSPRTLSLVTLFVLSLFVTPSYSSAQNLFPIVQNHRWGYIDSTGAIVIQPQYAYAGPFHEGYAWIVDSSKMEIAFGADALNATESISFSQVRDGTDYTWSLIDTHGKKLSHTTRSKMKPVVVNGYTVLFDGDYFRGGWGLMDMAGKIAVKGAYPSLDFMQEGKALAGYEDNGPYDFIDLAGKQITKLHFPRASSFQDGLAAASDPDSGTYGFLDGTGAWAIKPTYRFVGSFSEGLANVLRDSLYGFIDTKGKLVIPYRYSFVEKFSDGLARVKLNGLYGYIDHSGAMAIPATIEVKEGGAFEMDYHLYKFSNGLALAKVGDQYGYRDKSGAIAIPAIFQDAYLFENGLARVKKDSVWGYINRAGKMIWKEG